MSKAACAVLGTGNIGTDLMYKLLASPSLELRAMVGIDPDSDGLALARTNGVKASAGGLEWLQENNQDIEIIFEATSAKTHTLHAPILKDMGVTAIDLTPAAIGPPVIPAVNGKSHLNAPNVSLISCGGQATVPIVAAVQRVSPSPYAEMISTIASQSAGAGTRQNIDEFTRTTSAALASVGGSGQGKAIIVLNPAEPPILMRNTVYCGLSADVDRDAVTDSIIRMANDVADYVPGYRLRAEPIFDEGPFNTPAGRADMRVMVLLEVEGIGDYLPRYAGNLDVMTAAAVRVGELFARHRLEVTR